MKNYKIYIFVSIFFFSSVFILNGDVRKENLQLKELFLNNSTYLYKTPTGLKIKDKTLYVLDNSKSTIFTYVINQENIRFQSNIGRPGKGPGDLNYPFNICFSDNHIGVQDNVGISFFSYLGKFKSRFRIFGIIHDLELNGDMTYILNPDIKSQKMIHQFDKNGKKIRTFGSFFLKFKKENKKNIFWLYEGFLENDGRTLLYFSALYGKVIRFNFDGKKIEEKSYLPFIKHNGDKLLKINNELLKTGIEKKGSFFTGFSILGNVVVAKKYIYLLSLENFYSDEYLINKKKYKKPPMETIIIKVIDKDHWKLEKEYKIQAEHIYYDAFDVQEINGKSKFFICYSSLSGNSLGYAEESN